MATRRILLLGVSFGLLLAPTRTWAQSTTTGSIAGVVRDATGAVLPGVTVEAASPALIEKVRSTVSDDNGQYKIIELRPGTYTVSFKLPGFSTFAREGLELTTGFTATVNAELKVGSLEETVTVTGASPIVDVQNVRQQTVFRREAQEALPLGRNIAQWATMIPGASVSNPQLGHDVGGVTPKGTYTGIHGIDAAQNMGKYFDGMRLDSPDATFGFLLNIASVEETTLQTSGVPAESSTGTVQMNLVPREGGNGFRLFSVGNFANGSFQSKNITDKLRARGAAEATGLDHIHQINVGFGGPIKRDRIWFYTAQQHGLQKRFQSGNFFNATPESFFYTPDLNKPAYSDDPERDHQGRVTWQVSQKNKVNFHLIVDINTQKRFLSGTVAPEAAPRIVQDYELIQSTWSRPSTNRLLFDSGVTVVLATSNKVRQPGVTADRIAILDATRNYNYRAQVTGLTLTNAYGADQSNQANGRFATSYVTGSHAFKTGFQWRHDWRADESYVNQDIKYTLLNGRPSSITLWASPSLQRDKAEDMGVFAQDQWSLHKWTFNMGVRFDYFNGYVPEQHIAAGTYVPARDFAGLSRVPNWKDVTPRLGAAYDLFGNGKTALKTSLGKYPDLETAALSTALNNPVRTMVTSATRTWNDANGDFIPQENELGALSNANFGKTVPSERRAEDVLHGWGIRKYNWQYSAQLQHELREGMAINVGYFRTWFGNFVATDNLQVVPADFSPYCLKAPVDARLPGSGQQVCGLFDIAPAKFGLVDNLVTQVSNFGKQKEVFNGVDVTMNLRFGAGGTFQGGVATGSKVQDNCDTLVDSPDHRYCHVSPPWIKGTQVKFNAIYPLPWNLRIAAVYQNNPGVLITSSYVASNAEIAPSLGRNLGSCRGAAVCNGTATVELIEPGTMYDDRIKQLDLRLTRVFKFAKSRFQAELDVFNALNGSGVLSINTRYGPSWLQPTGIMGGRLFKLGFQLDM